MVKVGEVKVLTVKEIIGILGHKAHVKNQEDPYNKKKEQDGKDNVFLFSCSSGIKVFAYVIQTLQTKMVN
jgi:hypothetical protein